MKSNICLALFIYALSVDTSAAQDHQDPVYEMFRNFMGQFPNNNYVDPTRFMPAGVGAPFPGGAFGPASFSPFPAGGGGGGIPFGPGNNPFVPQGENSGPLGVTFGTVGNTVYPILNGMGYSGPFHSSEAGIPNPNYGNIGGGGGGGGSSFAGTASGQPEGGAGNVPIVNTRVNAGGSANGGPNGPVTSVMKTPDGSQVSVAVRNSPDGRPVYRSETVQGPNNSYGTAFAYSSG